MPLVEDDDGEFSQRQLAAEHPGRLWRRRPDGWSTEDDFTADDALPNLKMENAAVVGKEAVFSPYGYVITSDGTIYSLVSKYFHGVVLAMIFPELAAKCGYGPPPEDPDVYHYQRFELDNSRDLDAIRVAFGLLHPILVSRGKKAATEAQVEGLRSVFKAKGIALRDMVMTDSRDMPAKTALVAITREERF